MSTRWKFGTAMGAAFGMGFVCCYLLMQWEPKEIAASVHIPAPSRVAQVTPNNVPETISPGQRLVLVPSAVTLAQSEKVEAPLVFESRLIYPTMPPRLVK